MCPKQNHFRVCYNHKWYQIKLNEYAAKEKMKFTVDECISLIRLGKNNLSHSHTSLGFKLTIIN